MEGEPALFAPFYSDKFQKKTVMAGELLYPGQLRSHLEDLLEWKNLTLTKVYNAQPYTIEQLMDWVAEYGEKIRPFIRDTGGPPPGRPNPGARAAAGRPGR